jgi:ABC-type antimicrobial peptide transport system permease subunit
VAIAIRRALGAAESDIFWQFLFEAVASSVRGCFAGLKAGWRGTESIAERADLRFFFDGTSAALVAGFAILMNLVFPLIPSRRAAFLDPMRALNSELLPGRPHVPVLNTQIHG